MNAARTIDGLPVADDELPNDPAGRICRLKWLWHHQFEHKITMGPTYPQEFSYAGNGWPGQWDTLPGAANAKSYLYEQHSIEGDGVSAIEAIDDWYKKLPVNHDGKWYAVVWRVEPELASEQDFNSKLRRWRVWSRFAIIPTEPE